MTRVDEPSKQLPYFHEAESSHRPQQNRASEFFDQWLRKLRRRKTDDQAEPLADDQRRGDET